MEAKRKLSIDIPDSELPASTEAERNEFRQKMADFVNCKNPITEAAIQDSMRLHQTKNIHVGKLSSMSEAELLELLTGEDDLPGNLRPNQMFAALAALMLKRTKPHWTRNATFYIGLATLIIAIATLISGYSCRELADAPPVDLPSSGSADGQQSESAARPGTPSSIAGQQQMP